MLERKQNLRLLPRFAKTPYVSAPASGAVLCRSIAASFNVRHRSVAVARTSLTLLVPAAQPERAQNLARLADLKSQRVLLEAEVAAHADNDPEVYKAMLAKAQAAKAGADRWTDNVWALKSYLVKLGKSPAEVDALLGLTDDFDYVK